MIPRVPNRTTYHEGHGGILRATHLPCGTTERDIPSLEYWNDIGDCPVCNVRGVTVWEMGDGTLWETEQTEDDSFLRHQRVITHVQIRKVFVNGPQWWALPMPRPCDDTDDDLIAGFTEFRDTVDDLPRFWAWCQRATSDDGGVVWRSRSNPIYRITEPKGA